DSGCAPHVRCSERRKQLWRCFPSVSSAAPPGRTTEAGPAAGTASSAMASGRETDTRRDAPAKAARIARGKEGRRTPREKQTPCRGLALGAQGVMRVPDGRATPADVAPLHLRNGGHASAERC